MSTISSYDKTAISDDGSQTEGNKVTFKSVYTNLTDPIKTFVEANLEKANFSGSSAPTATDDSGDSYGVGSFWVDTSNDRAYICVDSSAAAAIWKSVGGPRGNFSATAAPTATDDANDSPAYEAGSLWMDVSNNKAYICKDATAGSADWDEFASAYAAKIATGVYTGDGTASNSITGVGFQPTYLKIWQRVTTDGNTAAIVETTDTIVDDHTSGGAIVHAGSGGHTFETNMIISLDSDGFTVDDAGADAFPNKADAIYNYKCEG